MRQLTREKRKTVNLTWLCCGIALIALVLIGFAFLLRNFVGHWPRPSFLGPSRTTYEDEDVLPYYPYSGSGGNGHSYDTQVPGEAAGGPVRPSVVRKVEEEGTRDFLSKPSTIDDRQRDTLFSENAPVKLDVVRRTQWGAHAAKGKSYLKTFAIEKAIVLETGTEQCYNVVSAEYGHRRSTYYG